MRRDTIGTAGTTRRVSLAVYRSCLVMYVKDTSQAHATKILDEKTGMQRFPFIPKISTSTWHGAQEIDITLLILISSKAIRYLHGMGAHDAVFLFDNEGQGRPEPTST